MEILSVIGLLAFIAFFYLYFLRNSIFGISFYRGNYSGFFFLYDFLVFILPASILLNVLPIEHFWVAFKVDQQAVFFVTILVLSTYLFFVLSVWLIYRSMPKYFFFQFPRLSTVDIKTYSGFVKGSIVLSIFLIFFAWIFLGVGHSFTISIVTGQSISQSRSEVKLNTIAKFISHLFIILPPLLTAIVASPVYRGANLKRVALFSFILFIATWGGSKEPVLSLFLVYFVSYATFNSLKPDVKTVLFSVVFLVFLLFFLHRVVLLQYPHMQDLSSFLDYFYQRVFVAQMIGVYEQFSLNIHDVYYFLHGIPFASFFTDVPVFHKDLMMITEDRLDAGAIGIKNTYFIAEAHAMGGWMFIIPAVMIYALNYALSFVFMVLILNLFLGRNHDFNKVICSIFMFSYISITGGFSDLMLFKVLIMMLILLSPVLLIGYLSRFKYVFKCS